MDNKEFLKLIKDIDEEDVIDEPIGWIDTGSYIINAALSTSIYGGFPDNGITAFHAKESVGKTYLAMSAAKQFLDMEATSRVLFFDTEGATRKETFQMRGIDFSRVSKKKPETIEKLQTMIYRFLTGMKSIEDRPKVLMVLDSLGMLPSSKERADAESGKEVRDMTKQSAGRSLFRTITADLEKLHIPFIVNAHSYTDVMVYGAPQVISGGGGIKYAANIIGYLSKEKDQEEVKKNGKKVKVHNGNILHLKIQKSRFAREDTKVRTRLDFKKGIDRYYGLLDLASQYDIIKKVSTQYVFPDGSKEFEKNIYKEPEKYFTKDILDKIDIAARDYFSLGNDRPDMSFDETNTPELEEQK